MDSVSSHCVNHFFKMEASTFGSWNVVVLDFAQFNSQNAPLTAQYLDLDLDVYFCLDSKTWMQARSRRNATQNTTPKHKTMTPKKRVRNLEVFWSKQRKKTSNEDYSECEFIGSGIFWICCAEICLWPHSSFLVLVTCWMHLRSANGRGPAPNVRCKSRHDREIQGRFPASWDAGHVDVMGRVGREAVNIWTKKSCFLFNISAWFLNSGFPDIFLRCLEIPRGSVQFYKSMIFGVVAVVGYESSLNGIAFWASLWIGFQDLKFFAFSSMDLTLKVWMLKYLDLLPRKLYSIVMENQILQMVGFSHCHLSFFFIWFVAIAWLRLSWFQSIQSLWERVSWPLLHRLSWRKCRMISRVTLEGCRNNLNELCTNILTLLPTWLQWLEHWNGTSSTERLMSLNLISRTQSTDDTTHHSTIV